MLQSYQKLSALAAGDAGVVLQEGRAKAEDIAAPLAHGAAGEKVDTALHSGSIPPRRSSCPRRVGAMKMIDRVVAGLEARQVRRLPARRRRRVDRRVIERCPRGGAIVGRDVGATGRVLERREDPGRPRRRRCSPGLSSKPMLTNIGTRSGARLPGMATEAGTLSLPVQGPRTGSGIAGRNGSRAAAHHGHRGIRWLDSSVDPAPSWRLRKTRAEARRAQLDGARPCGHRQQRWRRGRCGRRIGGSAADAGPRARSPLPVSDPGPARTTCRPRWPSRATSLPSAYRCSSAWVSTTTRRASASSGDRDLLGAQEPAGRANVATYDGTTTRATFYHSSIYATAAASWKTAYLAGFETGGPHGQSFSWRRRRRGKNFDVRDGAPRCGLYQFLTGSAVGERRGDIFGFRTPFLEYNASVFPAAKALNFWYDCSIQEGLELDQDGTNFPWPYTLDNGSPGHVAFDKLMPIATWPAGLWEMPAIPVIVPPDAEAAKYGIPTGLRAKADQTPPDHFTEAAGQITGLELQPLVRHAPDQGGVPGHAQVHVRSATPGQPRPLLSECTARSTPPLRPSVPSLPWSSGNKHRRISEIRADLSRSAVVSTKSVLDWIRNPVPLKLTTPADRRSPREGRGTQAGAASPAPGGGAARAHASARERSSACGVARPRRGSRPPPGRR